MIKWYQSHVRFTLPTVVLQRSYSLGQFHTWVQVPGFALQQVKHFKPHTEGNEVWITVAMVNKNNDISGLISVLLIAHILFLPPEGVITYMNAKNAHSLMLSLWRNGKAQENWRHTLVLWSQMNIIHFIRCFIFSNTKTTCYLRHFLLGECRPDSNVDH